MADIEIGVDAADAIENIQQLQRVFDRFAAASKEQVDTWRGVTGEVGNLATVTEGLHATMLGVADGLQVLLDRQDRLDQATERTTRRWELLSRHTRNFAGSIKGATESLLKWAGISSLLVGAAGFGAEHAVFDFANDVSARRSTALGYGTTYGGLASARANYARFGDADAALSNIAAAQTDPSRRLGLQNLHVASDGRDPTEVLSDAMKSVKDLLDRKPANVGLAQYSQNLHLDDVFSMGDLQRIEHSSRAEVREQADKMLADRRGLDLAPDVQKKWQDLSTQLSKAGTAIETVLVNRLVALEPGLERLSDAFTKVAQTLLAKDGPASQWLGELDKGLEWLATKLDDPNTQKNIGDFLTQVGHAAEMVWGAGKKALDLLHWLAKLTGEDAASSGSAADGAGVSALTSDSGIDLRTGTGGGLGLRSHRGGSGGFSGRAGLGSRGSVDARGITAVSKDIPVEGRALLDTLASGEAPGYNVLNGGQTFSSYAQHPGGRAAGRYQDLPSTWRRIQRETGLKDFSPESQDKGNWWLAQQDYRAHTHRDLLTDLRSKDPATIRNVGRALHSTWISLNDNFERKYGNYRARIESTSRPPAAPAKVTVSRTTGGSPATAVAAAAAPQ